MPKNTTKNLRADGSTRQETVRNYRMFLDVRPVASDPSP